MTQKIYLNGFDVPPTYYVPYHEFLRQHAISQFAAQQMGYAVELIFEDDCLTAALLYEDGDTQELELNPDQRGLPYVAVEPHALYELQPVPTAPSYLGGTPPPGVQLPEFDFVAPFQYLGMLARREPAFDWLPFDLHLMAPLYLNFDGLFVDYTDPHAPRVLDEAALAKIDNSFSEILRSDTVVEFSKTPVALERVVAYGAEFGQVGVPSWIQHPQLPICPKSGKPLRFLVQLGLDAKLKTVRTNVPSDYRFHHSFEHLNFWGDGDLYVFFEPESRVAYYLIQHT